MLRTCAVRLPAIWLTDSVSSFQTPDTPRTWAWPPSLPSVPTSRATRVTSDVNTESWSIILFDELGGSQEFAFEWTPVHFQADRLRQVALRDGADGPHDLGRGPHQIVDERVDRRDFVRACAEGAGDVHALFEVAFLADDAAHARHLVGAAAAHRDDVIEDVRNLAGDPDQVGRHLGREIAVPELDHGGEQ